MAPRQPQDSTGAADDRQHELLTQRIGILSKLLERRSAKLLATEFGLGVAEWRVLAQLARLRTPATVRAVAEQLYVDRAEVSRAAASLIRRGCVRRTADPADRRSALFACTEKGRKLYKKVRPLREQFNEKLVSALTAQQIADLDAAIAVLTTRMQERA